MTLPPSRPARRRLSRRAALALVPATGAALLAGTSATASPLPADAGLHLGREKGPLSVAYVEVNSNPLASVGDYVLAGTRTPVFDVAMIFAANINYDGTAAYLHLNERVTAVLEDAETQIRPLQRRGIRVVLSVLGNHQGAGFANFPDAAAADDFARQLADVVQRHRLDGIDFDDEWAKYGENGTGQPNDSSFVQLVTALDRRLPADKLITLYDIGPAAERTEHDGVRLGDVLDYAWNPYYGSWRPPQIEGMEPSRLAPAAVDITATPVDRAVELARRTVEEDYGALITYNLTDADHTEMVSALALELYGTPAVRLR